MVVAREDEIRVAGGDASSADRPPNHIGDHLAGFLGYESIRTSETMASSWVRVTDALQTADGGLDLLPLIYLIDSTAGVVCGAAARPDWIITTDLHFSLVDRRAGGRLRADASLVRASSVGVLAEVVVVDEARNDRVIATGSVNHARVPLTASLDVPDMPVGVRFIANAAQLRGDATLSAELPFESGPAAGELRFRPRPLGINPLGIVHGTVSTCLAVRTAEACAGPGWSLGNVVSRYCGSIRTGPAAANPKRVSVSPKACVVHVDIRDEAYAAVPANLTWVTLLRISDESIDSSSDGGHEA